MQTVLTPDVLNTLYNLVLTRGITPEEPDFIAKAIALENAKNQLAAYIKESNTVHGQPAGTQVLDSSEAKPKPRSKKVKPEVTQ